MALVPYLITALAETDTDGGGKNIVAGAVVQFFNAQAGGVAQTLYDDAASANPSTSKTTGVDGQVTVFVEQGQYWVSVNGAARQAVTLDNPSSIAAGLAGQTVPDSFIIGGSTSQIDTTANRALRVGDFGIGLPSNTGSSSIPDSNDFDDTPTGFFRSANSGTANLPGAVGGSVTLISEKYTSQTGTQIAIGIGGDNMWFRGNPSTSWNPWREIWHDGNLNVTEFNAASPNLLLAEGFASSSTVAEFYLRFNGYVAPTSLSFTGTFSIFRPGVGFVQTGIVPVVSALAPRMGVIQVSGLSGLTADDHVRLLSDSAASKIEVNY